MRHKGKRSGCSCPRCRECCGREPGWFMPDEIATAASFLGLSEREFIEKFCEEHVADGVLSISPRTKVGSSACIFLNKTGFCDIHPVKPYECRKVFGCEPAFRHKKIRDIIKKRWKRS